MALAARWSARASPFVCSNLSMKSLISLSLFCRTSTCSVRYGAVWCGAVRCGAVWCGVVRYVWFVGRFAHHVVGEIAVCFVSFNHFAAPAKVDWNLCLPACLPADLP